VPFQVGASPTFNYVAGQHNGSLTIRCCTVLTAPVSSSTISVIVSARGADDLEFGVPAELPPLSPFLIQSQDEYDPVDKLDIVTGNAIAPYNEKNLVYFGERIASFRQLLRRYSLARFERITPSGSQILYLKNMSKFPPPFGYMTAGGLDSAYGLITPGNAYLFNWVPTHPLTYLSLCYVGQRGSVNWSTNVVTTGPGINHVKVVRDPRNDTAATLFTNTPAAAITGSGVAKLFITQGTSTTQGNGASGQILTSQLTNAGTNFCIPNMVPGKFLSTNPSWIMAPPADTANRTDYSRNDFVKVEIVVDGADTAQSPMYVFMHAAMGNDLSFLWFNGTPPLYYFLTLPTSA